MESFVMEANELITEDFCESMLSRLSQSTRPDHQNLCAVINDLSENLKEQNLPRSPVALFAATCSSLDCLLSSGAADPLSDIVEPHTSILSLVFPRISAAVLKKEGFALRVVLNVLRLPSASAGMLNSGLKCLGQLLTIDESPYGKEFSESYGVLLNFVIHSDSKVRRQAQLCLRDVLQKSHGTKVSQPASEAIARMFQKYLDLAGKSEAESSEGPKGAQEVLYILDALKDSLCFMSMKYMTAVLERFKTLLMLRQPLVTRPVMDSLNAVCLYPTSEVPVDVLVDVLCLAADLLSPEETSADAMTFTARLLKVGMTRAFALNRDLCVIKLPGVFIRLKDILASEHEEAIYAAMDALKTLIHSCIDESLIREGVNRIQNSNFYAKKSQPTTIEKLCATIESLLDYQYSAVWDMAFQVVSAMFDKLGEHSSYFMKETLKNLSEMQQLPDEDFAYRNQLYECIGSALGAMGPETFLSILSLKLETSDLSEVNDWLFSILRRYTVGARLSFFTETILGMVETMSHKAQKLKQERPIASKTAESLVYMLWSLLPSFCNYPVDTAESFEDLEKILCRALKEQPNVRGIIYTSLHVLIQQNKEIVEGEEVFVDDASPAKQRAVARYQLEFAANNLKVLKLCAPDLLTVLTKLFIESEKDDGGSLQSTIGDLASIAEKKNVSRLLMVTLNQFLGVTKKAADAQSSSNEMQIDDRSDRKSFSVLRAKLLDLSGSLLPGLESAGVNVVLNAVELALQDAEGLIQKKAYKVLSIVLKSRDGFLLSKLEELLGLMVKVQESCHFSAKRHRLDCLFFLMAHASRIDNSEQRRKIIDCSFLKVPILSDVPEGTLQKVPLLTEVILALKEVNKKTRNRAYDVLVQIGHACSDEKNGANTENLDQLFNMVAGCIAGKTPDMISAAVKGLARLAYEFSDLVSTAYNLLPSTFLLLRRKNREIIKANLGLLKVLVAKSPVEQLQAHLKSIVEGLLKWQDETKSHFKAKVKLLLEMLVRKCGVEAVKSVMPQEHINLLKNIRKIKERKEKKLAAISDESRSQFSKATTSRASRWNHSKVFSEFGEEDEDSDAEYMDARSNFRSNASKLLKSKASSLRSKRNRSKSLPEDLLDRFEDEPLDLLDRSKTRSSLRSSELGKRKSESDEEPEYDSEGRLVIYDGDKPKKKAFSDPDSDAKSDVGSHFSMNSSRKNQKRRKTSESGYAYTGSIYTSKKAGGDVKRKDKLEPYAYWPLDRKMMSRRPEQRAAARRGMTSVVKLTKKLEGKSATTAIATKLPKFKRVQKKGAGKKKASKK